MARGDAFIEQNGDGLGTQSNQNGWAWNVNIAIRPANGAEVCLTSFLVPPGYNAHLQHPIPTSQGSSTNFNSMLNFAKRYPYSPYGEGEGMGMQNCKIFISYTKYLQLVPVGAFGTNDYSDYHVSGIITKDTA